MPAVGEFVTRDVETIRSSFLRVISNGLKQRGVADPNVTPNSDWYILGTAVALQCTVVEANCAIKANALLPDTAVGDELLRWAKLLGLSPQPAGGSRGFVTISSSAVTSAPEGTQLVDEFGQFFEVAIGGVFQDGDAVAVRAVSTGSLTNHEEGDILRWVDPPPFADEKATVGAGGLINGVDEEDDEDLRERVLAYIRNPPSSGNPQYVTELATKAASAVQMAGVYSAIQGPSTYHVAVAAAPTETDKTRVVDPSTVSGVIKPYIIGRMPTREHAIITSVVDVNTDVAFGLTIPDAPSAQPPGLGGGWVDASPWPAPDAEATFRCTVTAVTSSLQITVDATTPPRAGYTHIAWLSPTTWRLHRALISLVSGTSGAYVITLDAPFTGITTGCYVWPDCEQAQAYIDAVLGAFKMMGPGEKSTNASALIRGYRFPPPSIAWPYAVGPHMLRALSSAGKEVADVQFLHRTDGTTTLTGSNGLLKPQVPADVESAPNIFIPRHIGFYRNK